MRRTVIVGVLGMVGGAVAADRLARWRERDRRVREEAAEAAANRRREAGMRKTSRAPTAALREQVAAKLAKNVQAKNRVLRRATAS